MISTGDESTLLLAVSFFFVLCIVVGVCVVVGGVIQSLGRGVKSGVSGGDPEPQPSPDDSAPTASAQTKKVQFCDRCRASIPESELFAATLTPYGILCWDCQPVDSTTARLGTSSQGAAVAPVSSKKRGGTFCLVMGILGVFTGSLLVAPLLAVLAGIDGLSDWSKANGAYKTKTVIGLFLGVLYLFVGIALRFR